MPNLRNIELVATACDSSKITAYSWVQLVVIRAKHVDVQKAWSEKLIDPPARCYSPVSASGNIGTKYDLG